MDLEKPNKRTGGPDQLDRWFRHERECCGRVAKRTHETTSTPGTEFKLCIYIDLGRELLFMAGVPQRTLSYEKLKKALLRLIEVEAHASYSISMELLIKPADALLNRILNK